MGISLSRPADERHRMNAEVNGELEGRGEGVVAGDALSLRALFASSESSIPPRSAFMAFG